MADTSQIRKLEGWLTLTEAAERTGYTKQGIHRLVFDADPSPFDYETEVRGAGEKPLILLKEEAVERLAARRVDAPHGTWKITPPVAAE